MDKLTVSREGEAQLNPVVECALRSAIAVIKKVRST